MTMSNLLVLAETDGSHILPSTLPSISFAQAWAYETGGGFDLLLAGGPGIADSAAEWSGFGAGSVYVVADSALAHRQSWSSCD